MLGDVFSMTRPKHTKHDSNHAAIVKELREAGCVVIDVSDLAGTAEDHPLDLFVLNPERTRWVQVEIKAERGAPFTVSERVYLRRLGCWPPEAPHWCPVIVAYSARDVLCNFEGNFAQLVCQESDARRDKTWIDDDGPEM